MNVSIRDYQASDFEVCRSLWAELTLYHQEIYEDPTIGGGDPGRGFEAYLNNTERRGTWVAELEGEVMAFSGLLVHWEEEGEIEPVIVSSPHRRKGIGTMLVRHVVEEAKKRKIRFLGARPVARNKDAISFFVKLGFNRMGQIELFQELSPLPERTWKPGIIIHGKELRY
jgi:N-acetylglutamate synthase-like GNAT family acetyltransferase